MILYVGPDQIIPLSGVIGTIIGMALIFWNKVVVAAGKVASYLVSKRSTKENGQSPV